MTQPVLFQTTAAERYATAERNNNSGRQRKQRGQDATVAAERKEWVDRALFLLKTYLSSFQPGDEFAFEDARAYMDTCGLPPPHVHNVWGAFPAIAKANGARIEMTDRVRPARSPKTNAHAVRIWRVTE